MSHDYRESCIGALHPKLYATRNLCMHDFLKFYHNCDAYMGVQKERKSTFLTALEHREKRLAACLLHNMFIAVVSECLCHLKAQYLVAYSSQIFVLVNRFQIFTTHVSVME